MAKKLKACPFCGFSRARVEDFGDEHLAHVRCEECGAEGPERKTWAEAIEAWETRTPPRTDGDGL